MNKYEIGTIFKSIGIGILVALGIFLVLLCLSLFTDLWNCFCDIFCTEMSCHSVEEFSSNYVVYIFSGIISVSVGFIVGLFSALSKKSQRKRNETDLKNAANYKSILKELASAKTYANQNANAISAYSPKFDVDSESLKKEFYSHSNTTENKHRELSQIVNDCKNN